MEKGWRTEEGGIKMKGQIESRMKEEDGGMKVKSELRSKVDDKVALDTKLKVENKKKGKVDDYKSEKRDEIKIREAVTMRMKEKVEDKVKGKVEVQMAEAIKHKIKDDRLENRIQEKVGANIKTRDGHKMKGEVGIEEAEKDGFNFKKNVGVGMKEKVDDKLKDKFQITMKVGLCNLVQEVGNEIKNEPGIKMREEIVNKTQRFIGNNMKGMGMSNMEKFGRNTSTEVKEKVGDEMIVKSGIDANEKIGYGIEENVSGIVQEDVGTHKKEEDKIKMKEDIRNKKIARDVNEDIVDSAKVRSGLAKKKENGQNSKEKIGSTTLKDIGTRRREEDGIKVKKDVESKTITKDVNKEIVENVTVQSGFEKKRENGQDSKEINQDVGNRRKEEDGNKMKGDIESKIMRRDVDKEIVENVEVHSGLEKKRENGQDSNEKFGSIIQKDVGIHRKEDDTIEMEAEKTKVIVENMEAQSGLEKKRESGQDSKGKHGSIMQKILGIHKMEQDGIKLKGDIENKSITRDINKDIVGNVKVQSDREKARENGHDLKVKVGRTMQKDIDSHKNEDDGIKMKRDVENQMITRDVKKETVDNVKAQSVLVKKRENGLDLKEEVGSATQKVVGTHKKEEDGIKTKRDIENKMITRDMRKEIVENVKVQSRLEKKGETGHDLKEKIGLIMQKDVCTLRKVEDGIKIKGDIQNKVIRRDINKEILDNVKVQSRLEKYDSKEKIKIIMQKDVVTHRKVEDGIKMKGDIGNKIIRKDVKVHSRLDKKKENGHDSRENVRSTMQNDVETHKKEDDGIKAKKGIENKVTLGDEVEVVEKIKEKSDETDRFVMKGSIEYSMKKEAENQFKAGKQNELKDVVDDKISEKFVMENKINESCENTMAGEIGNKKIGDVEKTKRREFVDNIKEKFKNVLREESGISEKERDAINLKTVDERFKEEVGTTISKHSVTIKEDETVNSRKEEVGHKSKGPRDKIEGKIGIKEKEEIKGGIREKVGDKMKDKGKKEKVEDTMRARHVIRKDEKNRIKMKEDVENKTKEKIISIKENEGEHNMKGNVGIKIKGKVENILIEKARSIKEKNIGNKMKAKIEHKARGEVGAKSKEKDERLGNRMKEEVGHKTKKNVVLKKEEKVEIKMKGGAKIKKEKE